MKIKAIGFDIGGTLVNYNKPLNWSASYEDAIKYMCQKNNIKITEERLEQAKGTLTKYNTRVNPRENEVSAKTIFKEIFEKWGENNEEIIEARKSFFEYFQREAILYKDAEPLLKYCKEHQIECAVYTDVAYGMEDDLSLKDIDAIDEYIELKLTSLNVGYRKPNKKAFEIMIEKFKCIPEEMLFIGDEEKDIKGAKSVGMKTALINRDEKQKDFMQDYTVSNLEEIINIID